MVLLGLRIVAMWTTLSLKFWINIKILDHSFNVTHFPMYEKSMENIDNNKISDFDIRLWFYSLWKCHIVNRQTLSIGLV